MIIKSYIAEQNITVLKDYKFILIYGENEGIKDEFKKKIRDQNKDSEIINFFQEELLKSENLLISEILNISLFSTKKLFFIYISNDKIFKQIEDAIIDAENQNIKIVIFSDILDKKSKFRNLFEKSKKSLAALPCYKDDDRNLHKYINEKLKGYIGVTPEIINLIIINSNSNRKIIQQEIDKMKIFFSKKTINLKNTQELLNIKQINDFEELRDASLLGNKIKTNTLIGQVQFIPENNFYFLNDMARRLVKLKEINQQNLITKDLLLTVETMSPKIFWKDKPILIEQSKKWEIKKLDKVLKYIWSLEFMMKKNSNIQNNLLLKNLIIKVCMEAS